MLKKLFCKHKYKYYNTRVAYPFGSIYGHNVFQFVCMKCGKVTEASQKEIDDAISQTQSLYNKSVVLGGEKIKSSELYIPRHMNCGICYHSPAVTLVLEDYMKRGVDLTELDY